MHVNSLRVDPVSSYAFEPVKEAEPLVLDQIASPITPSYTALLLAIIDTLEKMHATGSNLHAAQSAHLVRLQGHLEELQKQNLEIRKQIDEKSQTSSVWSTLGTILDYIGAAIRFVLGSLLMDETPEAGTLLRTTSLISLANLAFSACGVWNWVGEQVAGENDELAKQIATTLPLLVSLVSTGLGFVATGEILAMAGEVEWAEQILAITQMALGFAEGVTNLGKGYCDHQALTSQAELTHFQSGVARDEHGLERLMLEMDQTIKALGDCTTAAARMIKFSNYSSQKTVQQI